MKPIEDVRRCWEALTNGTGEQPVLEIRPADDALPSNGGEDYGWSAPPPVDHPEDLDACHARLYVADGQVMAVFPHVGDPFNYNVEVALAVAAAGGMIHPLAQPPQKSKIWVPQ
jgi:hypothetical protein